MSHARTADPSQLEALHPLFASATHEASAAMGRWTNGLITLGLDEICEIPLEDVCSELNRADELLTMVVVSLDGEIGGEMILSLDERNGRRLAAALLGREPDPGPEWSGLEKSALAETGNIFGRACANALTRWIHVNSVPSPPSFVRDDGAGALTQALMAQAASCDRVLVGRGQFHRQGETLRFRVLFVPNEGLRKAMETGPWRNGVGSLFPATHVRDSKG
jgi:chemotaxis protein CheC